LFVRSFVGLRSFARSERNSLLARLLRSYTSYTARQRCIDVGTRCVRRGESRDAMRIVNAVKAEKVRANERSLPFPPSFPQLEVFNKYISSPGCSPGGRVRSQPPTPQSMLKIIKLVNNKVRSANGPAPVRAISTALSVLYLTRPRSPPTTRPRPSARILAGNSFVR